MNTKIEWRMFVCLGVWMLTFLYACQTEQEKRINVVLDLAKENSRELKQVLQHFDDDEPKNEAAHFLVENMIYHKGYDQKSVHFMDGVYETHKNISERHDWRRDNLWEKEVDSFWYSNSMERLKNINLNLISDYSAIDSHWLISEVDSQFEAWALNPHAQSIPFELFMKQILPYRFVGNGYFKTNRHLYNERHQQLLSFYKEDFKGVIDSLSRYYNKIQHNNFAAIRMPVLRPQDLETIKRGSCDDMALFNCNLLSSLGYPVSIDFVPAWGNRSSAHSWNAVVIDGETHPFEPFYEEDRWKYKQAYSNKGFDPKWGKSRLPKVYRNTYHAVISDLQRDYMQGKMKDIPTFFKNPLISDVSDQYFDAKNIQLELPQSYATEVYCYLCVFSTDGWKPVQWGKINRGQVVFENMGSEVIYFPMIYTNGDYTPCHAPVLITDSGELVVIEPENKKESIKIRASTSFLFDSDIAHGKNMLRGARITGRKTNETEEVSLYAFTDSLDMWFNKWDIFNGKGLRYISLRVECDTIGLCELKFYDKDAKQIVPVSIKASLKSLKNGEVPEMITDTYSATGYKGVFESSQARSLEFDLGQECDVYGIECIPYTESFVVKDVLHTLYYWDNRWIKIDARLGNDNYLEFENVPEGSVLRLQRESSKERIFINQENTTIWF